MTIYSIPLSKLTAINPELNAEFLHKIIADIPKLGKEADNHFLVNNNFTIFNPQNIKHITVFNMFMEASRPKGEVIQFTKD